MNDRLTYFSLGITLLTAALLATAPLHAADRVALVIGNSAYEHAPRLANPANDARGVAAALRRLNFEVIEGYDRNHEQMRRLVQTFANRALSAEVALVYYAGHGAQVNGSNYLLPVDSRLDNVINLTFETLELDEHVLQPLELEHGAPLRIVILDACRDNPLADKLARSMPRGRSAAVGRGLGRTDVAVGTLIAYATQPDNIALDVGGGGHSPFTAALLNHIETPGLEIGMLIRRVRGEVLENTRQKQHPWDRSSLIGEFYFKPDVAEPVAEPVPAPPLPDNKLVQVAALLRECDAHLRANRLTTGAGGTALGCYTEVLTLERGNAQALAGLEAIAARYLQWAEAALEKGDSNSAQRYLERLEKVNPEHPQLEALRGRLTVASVVPVPAPAPEPSSAVQFPVINIPAPLSNTAGADEQTLYDTAFADLQAGQYQQAITGFQTFLANYPNSPQASNAQYWLGESYYVTRNFDRAKQTFLNLDARYPRSEKLPDTMLKLGYIYEALGNTNKARQMYQKLIQVYPDHRSAKTASQRLNVNADKNQPAGSATGRTRALFIQTASFHSAKEAERAKAELNLLGLRAHITTTEDNGITWNKVRLGPCTDRNKRQAVYQQLRDNGITAIMLEITSAQ